MANASCRRRAEARAAGRGDRLCCYQAEHLLRRYGFALHELAFGDDGTAGRICARRAWTWCARAVT